MSKKYERVEGLPTVLVRVSGPRGSGVSTVRAAIGYALRDYGFNVRFVDDCGEDYAIPKGSTFNPGMYDNRLILVDDENFE